MLQLNSMHKNKHELHSVHIPSEWLSRGTGEVVQLQEATVFDFMPQIIGSRFMAGELNARLYNNGQGAGSFMASEDAYYNLAEDELQSGNLIEALDAYKRCLHYSVGFLGAMAALRGNALLNRAELDRLDLSGRFGDLEQALIRQIVAQDVALPASYPDFVKDVRQREKRYKELNKLFYDSIKPTAEGPRGDKKLGEEYITHLVERGEYTHAGGICQDLGDEEGKVHYWQMAHTMPKNGPNPRAQAFMDAAYKNFGLDKI